jgi:hypothetical protein
VSWDPAELDEALKEDVSQLTLTDKLIFFVRRLPSWIGWAVVGFVIVHFVIKYW